MLNSDLSDNGRLSIDGERLIDFVSQEYFYFPIPHVQESTVWLRQGLHPVVWEYYRGSIPTIHQMSVAPPGEAQRPVKAGDFFHATGKN